MNEAERDTAIADNTVRVAALERIAAENAGRILLLEKQMGVLTAVGTFFRWAVPVFVAMAAIILDRLVR